MHEYGVPHSHESGAATTMDQMTAILTYMLDHNRHHAEELSGIADKLAESGRNEAAQLLRESVENMNQGNDKLAEALELAKEGR